MGLQNFWLIMATALQDATRISWGRLHASQFFDKSLVSLNTFGYYVFNCFSLLINFFFYYLRTSFCKYPIRLLLNWNGFWRQIISCFTNLIIWLLLTSRVTFVFGLRLFSLNWSSSLSLLLRCCLWSDLGRSRWISFIFRFLVFHFFLLCRIRWSNLISWLYFRIRQFWCYLIILIDLV